MNLADAGFGQSEHFRNLPQVQIFSVIKREHFSLDLRQFLEPLEHHVFQLVLRGLLRRAFLGRVGHHFVKAAGVAVFA